MITPACGPAPGPGVGRPGVSWSLGARPGVRLGVTLGIPGKPQPERRAHTKMAMDIPSSLERFLVGIIILAMSPQLNNHNPSLMMSVSQSQTSHGLK